MVDAIADYRASLEQYPVRSQVEPGYLRPQLPASYPETAESLDDVLSDVQKLIIPGMTHWQHPKFFACVQPKRPGKGQGRGGQGVRAFGRMEGEERRKGGEGMSLCWSEEGMRKR